MNTFLWYKYKSVQKLSSVAASSTQASSSLLFVTCWFASGNVVLNFCLNKIFQSWPHNGITFFSLKKKKKILSDLTSNWPEIRACWIWAWAFSFMRQMLLWTKQNPASNELLKLMAHKENVFSSFSYVVDMSVFVCMYNECLYYFGYTLSPCKFMNKELPAGGNVFMYTERVCVYSL